MGRKRGPGRAPGKRSVGWSLWKRLLSFVTLRAEAEPGLGAVLSPAGEPWKQQEREQEE